MTRWIEGITSNRPRSDLNDTNNISPQGPIPPRTARIGAGALRFENLSGGILKSSRLRDELSMTIFQEPNAASHEHWERKAVQRFFKCWMASSNAASRPLAMSSTVSKVGKSG